MNNNQRNLGPLKAIRKSESLTVVKKESHLIAKNPTRFLQNFVNRKASPSLTDTSSLNAAIEFYDEEGLNASLTDKVKDIIGKSKLSKTRTFLLGMSSNESLNSNLLGKAKRSAGSLSTVPSTLSIGRPRDSARSFSATPRTPIKGASLVGRSSRSAHSFLPSPVSSPHLREAGGSKMLLTASSDENETMGYYNRKLDRTNPDAIKEAIDDFTDRVRNADIDNIIVWINTLACMNDENLPLGYPELLQVPRNPGDIKDPELRMFTESACDEFLLLDGEYYSKLEELTKCLEENWKSLQSSRWKPKDSALLFYIITGLEDSSNTLLKTELIREFFPKFNPEQVALQKYRLRMKRAWEEKRGSIIRDWIRDRKDLVQKINEGWKIMKESKGKRHEVAKDRKEQLDRCKYWKDQVERMRREKKANIRRIQTMIEPYEVVIEARERYKVSEEAQKREAQKELLAQYRLKQRTEMEKEEKEKGRLEAELERNMRIQAHYNKMRVELRNQALEKKKQDQQELKVLKEEEAKLRKALLEKSKHKVELDYDPSSFLADTQASMMRRHEIQSLLDYEEEEQGTIKFFAERYAHSFSSEDVMKDRRVRVEKRLREAGLIGSTYARNILLSMEPKPKPHLKSNIDFDFGDDKANNN